MSRTTRTTSDSASPIEPGQRTQFPNLYHDKNTDSPNSDNHDNQTSSPSADEVAYPAPVKQKEQRVSTSLSSSYPSWLPARPQVPQPPSTFSATHTQRKITPRSVRIAQHQDSPERRQPTDETRVAGRVKAWSRARAASFGMSPETLSAISAYTPRPRFREPALHLDILRSPSPFARIQYHLVLPLLLFAHIPLQTYFDFNAVFILIQLSSHPVPGYDASGRNWTLATVTYIACWAVWLFGVTVLYEVVYLFVRHWRTKRPLMTPLYFSFPAQSLVSLTSYTNFCFIRYTRRSAFKASFIRDGLAETCWFYSQNLPTVVLALIRAGICLAILFAFSSAEYPYDGARDATYFDSDGVLTAYAKGVLIANSVWAVWRSLFLLISWLGLWLVSGTIAAGICGPRYRPEEEVNEKMTDAMTGLSPSSQQTSFNSIPIPWEWKDRTRRRILDAHDFCLTTATSRKAQHNPSDATAIDGEMDLLPAMEKTLGQPAFEKGDIEKIMAAVGVGAGAVAASPRRGALTEKTFQTPKSSANEGTDEDIITEQRRDTGSVNFGLYPFPGYGYVSSQEPAAGPSTCIAQLSASPTSDSRGLSRFTEGEADYEDGLDIEDGDLQLHDDDNYEGRDKKGYGKGAKEFPEEDIVQLPQETDQPRSSDSMSSLGTPLPPHEYPFQIGHVLRSTTSSSVHPPVTQVLRPSPSRSQASFHSSNHSHSHYVPLFRDRVAPTATKQSRPSSRGESDESSPASSSSGHGYQSVSSSHSLAQAEAGPSGIPLPPRHPHAHESSRQRPTTSSPPAQVASVAFPSVADRRTGPAYASPVFQRDDDGWEYDDDYESPDISVETRRGHSQDSSHEQTESADEVGLLSGSAHPSPRPSIVGGAAFRARTRTRSRATSGSLSSRTRDRAQSLIQSIGQASRSSVNLIRARSRSAATRLLDTDEVEPSHGDMVINPQYRPESTHTEEQHLRPRPLPSMVTNLRQQDVAASTTDSSARNSALSSSATATVDDDLKFIS